ncbi:MAG: lipopolysaccharide biosynthesis protein [Oceanococcus sp.]
MALTQSTALALRMLTIGRLSGQVFNWATTLLVIRLLNAEDYGLMALAVMFIASAGILSELGIGHALVQKKQLDLATQQRAFGLLLVISSAALLLLCATAEPAAVYFNAPELSDILIVLALQFPLTALGAVPDAMLRRQMQFGRKAWVEFAGMVTGAVCTLVLALYGWGVWALVIGNLAMISTRTAGFILAHGRLPWPKFQWSDNGQLLRFGGALTLGHLLWIVYTQADTFLISKTLGPVTLGFYAIALQIASLPMQKLASIINDVGFAALSRLANQREEFSNKLLQAVDLCCATSFPIFFGIAAVAPEFVALVLGDKWIKVTAVLPLLALSLPLRMLATLLPTALHAINQTRVSLLIRAITAVIMVVSFAVSVPHGIVAVALTWALVFPLCLLISLALALPALQIRWRHFWAQCWPYAMAATAMFFGVIAAKDIIPLWHLDNFPTANAALDLLSLCALGAAIYLLLTLLLRPQLPKKILRLIQAR